MIALKTRRTSSRLTMKSEALLGSLVSILVLASCTRTPSTSVVRLQLPTKRVSAAAVPVSRDVSSRWGYSAPTTAAETDCYAVFVQASDLSQSVCTALDGTNVTNLSALYGQYAAGSAIAIDVPKGNGRTIGVWAFKSANGTCGNYSSLSASQFSAPSYIGSTTINVVAATMNADINASFTGAQQIEQCKGGTLGSWPPAEACTPAITQVKLISGPMLEVDGACLDQATGLQLKNNSTSANTVMNILTKTATKITASVASDLTMKSGQIYSVIVPLANAAVPMTAQLTLSLDPVVTLKSGGTVIGTVLNDYSSGNILIRTPSGVIAYYNTDGTGHLNLASWMGSIPTSYSGLSAATTDRKLANLQISLYSIYFSGTNCTGDIIIPGSSQGPGTLLGNYLSYPTCPGGGSCSNSVGKITTSPTYNASLAYTSLAGMGMSCYAASPGATIAGFDIGTPVPLDAGDLQTIAPGWTLNE